MIGEKLRYHGVALTRLVQDAGETVSLQSLSGTSRCAYLVNDEVVVFLKYATSRLSPWRFGFSADQRRQLDILSVQFTATWIVLVCGNEGVLTVPWAQVEAELTQSRESNAFSLQASRRRGEKFRLSGASEKPFVISESDFPARLLA